jgi:dTDP-4-dehydrorhamnose reductase
VKPLKVLILGATGLLGHMLFQVLSEKKDWEVLGTARNKEVKKLFSPKICNNLIDGFDANSEDDLIEIFDKYSPDIVINCISVTRALLSSGSPLDLIPIFSVLPHRLLKLSVLHNVRLIHISTDGVFSGAQGFYSEQDIPDSHDLYGMTKQLGELNSGNAITLRSSFIGPELQGNTGLLNWFLSQEQECKCFSDVIFSGLTTFEFSKIIRDYVIPNGGLHGLYHVASSPISKYDLLKIVAQRYKKDIKLIPINNPVSNRSLNPYKFNVATGYKAPEWTELIEVMAAYEQHMEK